ncbi:MAG: 6-pyruvoyl-tetrahydropterin synthase-related protein, partial [Methanosarcinales archaeon]
MFELKKMKDKLRSVDKNILTILSLFLIVTLYTYYPYLKTGDLPLTDASGHFFNTWYLKKILTEDHTFPNWCEYWYSGHPFLLLYSPMTYLLVILLSFTGLSLVSAFNLVLFLSVYGQTLLIFFLMRKITDDNYVSAFSALLLISSPRFFKDVIYSGSLPNQVASTIGLLVLYLYINRDLNLRHIIYISLALAGVVYAHHENSPVVVIAMLCILLSLIIFDKKNVS